jgi:hypothetical protein
MTVNWMKHRLSGWLVLAICAAAMPAFGAKQAPQPPLSDKGLELQQQYQDMLTEAKAAIVAAAPKVDARKLAVFNKAREAEEQAIARLAAAQAAFGEIAKGHALVGHAKNKWIAGAKKGIADTQAKLKKATTDAERAELQKKLADWQKNLADGEAALKERQAKLDKALANKAQLERELEAAKQNLAQAKQRTLVALKGLGLEPFLASDDLDGKLAKFQVLAEGTPQRLAGFAQQSDAHEALVDKLLADEELMVQMMANDGAAGGNYGRAMQIYTDIHNASNKASSGVLQNLALGIALEHAQPRGQRSAKALADAPSHVDPVKRYLAYEKAFLAGELDPAFETFTPWELRMVVDGEEPDEIAAWGRAMLRDYRPDHIMLDDYKWRYVAAVRTEIRYGSQENKYDKDELQFFQNILMNGGICGRRAFFGRFILRSFGIPTTARPQRGHAALTHWTPDGWVVNLGAGWGHGWTKTRYKDDKDFLAVTQAREDMTAYMQVKRAQWTGDALGEKPVYGFHDKAEPGFWYGASLYKQRQIINDLDAKTLAAEGEELGEANESNVKYAIVQTEVTDADRQIETTTAGTIMIPAAATSKPTKTTGKIIFMPSAGGGLQMHYGRTGKHEPFEYTFNAPAAGKYKLTATVASSSWKQNLLVSTNGGKAQAWMMPHTVGLFDTTQPIVVELNKGKNVLTFTREGAPAEVQMKGITFKQFTLTPTR